MNEHAADQPSWAVILPFRGTSPELRRALELIVQGAVAAGGKVVAKEFTTDKGADFNAILTAIKGKKPDLVFFGGMVTVAGPMLT